VAEFTEIESSQQADRPALAKAFQACRLRRAKLVIAKLDRLSRDAYFLLGSEKVGVAFVVADMPTASRLTVGIMAMVTDEERCLISKRTRGACSGQSAGREARGQSGRYVRPTRERSAVRSVRVPQKPV
jgi:DNA invertase Pin-like site-specific DNA recombinase